MTRFACFIITLLSVISLVACQSQSQSKADDDRTSKKEYFEETEKKRLTYYEAIEYAQEAAENEKVFLSYYHHSIDWATCSGNLTEDDRWELQLKGRIYGYWDDGKAMRRDSGSFQVTAQFDSTGGYVIFTNGRVS